MSNFEETMEHCREFVNTYPLADATFEIFACNQKGFDLRLRNGYYVQIRVEHFGGKDSILMTYVTMEVYPGIKVQSPYVDMVAEYFQKISSVPHTTFLCITPIGKMVSMHAETCYRDNPTSVETLTKILDNAVAVLEKHEPVIRSLANGRLPDLHVLETALAEARDIRVAVVPVHEQLLLGRNIDAMHKFLADGKHNVRAVNSNRDSSELFILESLTKRDCYRGSYHISDGWFTVSMRSDIRVEPAFITRVSRYINDINADKRVGHLALGNDGHVYSSVSTYLLDGETPISGVTIREMEKISLVILVDAKKLIYEANGVNPPYGAEYDEEKELLDPELTIEGLIHQLFPSPHNRYHENDPEFASRSAFTRDDDDEGDMSDDDLDF